MKPRISDRGAAANHMETRRLREHVTTSANGQKRTSIQILNPVPAAQHQPPLFYRLLEQEAFANLPFYLLPLVATIGGPAIAPSLH